MVPGHPQRRGQDKLIPIPPTNESGFKSLVGAGLACPESSKGPAL